MIATQCRPDALGPLTHARRSLRGHRCPYCSKRGVVAYLRYVRQLGVNECENCHEQLIPLT